MNGCFIHTMPPQSRHSKLCWMNEQDSRTDTMSPETSLFLKKQRFKIWFQRVEVVSTDWMGAKPESERILRNNYIFRD